MRVRSSGTRKSSPRRSAVSISPMAAAMSRLLIDGRISLRLSGRLTPAASSVPSTRQNWITATFFSSEPMSGSRSATR